MENDATDTMWCQHCHHATLTCARVHRSNHWVVATRLMRTHQMRRTLFTASRDYTRAIKNTHKSVRNTRPNRGTHRRHHVMITILIASHMLARAHTHAHASAGNTWPNTGRHSRIHVKRTTVIVSLSGGTNSSMTCK